jgi:hypothetical protein
MNGAKKSAVGMSASMSVGTADEACARATWNRRYGSNAGLAPAAARKTRCGSAQRKIGRQAHRCRRRAAGVDVGERDAEHGGRGRARRRGARSHKISYSSMCVKSVMTTRYRLVRYTWKHCRL